MSSWRRPKRASGGRSKPAILAGACEAVIAALYLDGGMEAARAFIERYWASMFDDPGSADMRDAKTRLQEWAQGRGRGARAPVYTLVGAKAPTMRRASWSKSRSTGMAPERARAAPSAKPNRTRPARLLARVANAMTTRCGFCAIIGAPNAGKSTLVNALVGSKVAIVTPKVQTTRMTVRGVAMTGDTQIVFVDTPGIFKPRRRLDRAMVSAAWAGADDADAILLVVDAADLAANPTSHCRPRHRRDPRRA